MVHALRFPKLPALSLAATFAAGAAVWAQMPGPEVASPVVESDHRVTFRIHAPKAAEVLLRGDWMSGMAGERLEQGTDGVWAVTVGPLVPDYYSYAFWVDGVKTVDPVNPEIKQGIRGLDSMVFLPGPESGFQENRAVPHGEIRKVWYASGNLGAQRRMHVYTPPGYESESRKYPVLYLLHGGGDEDSGWSTIGRAGFILDNLIASGRAVPMLIVMPNGSLPMPANLPRFTPGAPPPPEWTAAVVENQRKFTRELVGEIIPLVERNFRVLAGREHRAVAGLSMGGGQTLQVLAQHPDRFAHAAIWSAGIWGSPDTWEQQNQPFLTNPELNQWIRSLDITIGNQDFLLEGAHVLNRLFDKYRIRHQFQLTEGGHTWINWRRYLRDLLPRLFSGPPPA